MGMKFLLAISLLIAVLTRDSNGIVIVKRCGNEDIEKVCGTAGLSWVGATAYNINTLTNMLKECNIPNAAVFSWNGQPARLVLQQNGALNPFNQQTNPTDYVFCARKCHGKPKQVCPPVKPYCPPVQPYCPPVKPYCPPFCPPYRKERREWKGDSSDFNINVDAEVDVDVEVSNGRDDIDIDIEESIDINVGRDSSSDEGRHHRGRRLRPCLPYRGPCKPYPCPPTPCPPTPGPFPPCPPYPCFPVKCPWEKGYKNRCKEYTKKLKCFRKNPCWPRRGCDYIKWLAKCLEVSKTYVYNDKDDHCRDRWVVDVDEVTHKNVQDIRKLKLQKCIYGNRPDCKFNVPYILRFPRILKCIREYIRRRCCIKKVCLYVDCRSRVYVYYRGRLWLICYNPRTICGRCPRVRFIPLPRAC